MLAIDVNRDHPDVGVLVEQPLGHGGQVLAGHTDDSNVGRLGVEQDFDLAVGVVDRDQIRVFGDGTMYYGAQPVGGIGDKDSNGAPPSIGKC